MSSRDDITKLLADLNAGKDGAEETLMPLVYNELRNLARRYMRTENKGHTLQTTALVHEAYLRLGGERDTPWENKAHYMRVAARAMRHILIDHSRRKQADRKGGKWGREPLYQAAELMEEVSFDLLDLDSALNRMSKIDQRMAQVVELRFFGGLSVEQTAKVLGISKTTVKREWVVARTWLKQSI
ncbi:MAG: sigma-70 family RNA polymerase sigma factor [Planctomycetota bacterium]|jgi:RNA polymerase sigma factor (TIGR02999 family)